MEKELTLCEKAERSITKKYRKKIWAPFIRALKQYELIEEGDKIAVCISGGKDSMLLAKLIQLLKKHTDFPFEAVFLVMNPGYNKLNREKIALLQFKLSEMIEREKLENPKVVIMLTNLELTFVDGYNLEFLLDNILACPKVHTKHVKILSLI